jgi:hypothetical protein
MEDVCKGMYYPSDCPRDVETPFEEVIPCEACSHFKTCCILNCNAFRFNAVCGKDVGGKK